MRAHKQLAAALAVILTAALVGTVLVVRAHAAPRSSVAGATAIRVTEQYFHISAPKQVSSGDLVVTVTNKGPGDHELLVVRTPTGQLPLRSDGLTVNEEKLTAALEPSLEPAVPGTVRTLRLHLLPGRYLFICNMAGHYMSGMHSTLVVR
jgi:uncharacterized cupredoxin-like copper-binding protein